MSWNTAATLWQVHATLYRELLGLLQREALLAGVVTLIAAVCEGPFDGKKQLPLTRKTRPPSERIPACTRAGTQLERRRCTGLSERSPNLRRSALPQLFVPPWKETFEGAHHPFVDRCDSFSIRRLWKGPRCRYPHSGRNRGTNCHAGAKRLEKSATLNSRCVAISSLTAVEAPLAPRPVRQHFRNSVHHFRRVIPKCQHRVRTVRGGVLQKQLVRLAPRSFAQIRQDRNVPATIVCNAAPKFPITLRERTMIPRTTPKFLQSGTPAIPSPSSHR